MYLMYLFPSVPKNLNTMEMGDLLTLKWLFSSLSQSINSPFRMWNFTLLKWDFLDNWFMYDIALHDTWYPNEITKTMMSKPQKGLFP